MKKIIISMEIFILMILGFTTFAIAAPVEGTDGVGASKSSILTPDSVTPTADTNAQLDLKNIGGKIIGGIQSVGTVVSVLILVVLGIKYMIGSAEERAEYKKSMIPYLVGSVLLFGAVTIASMVYKFSSSI